LFLKTASTYHYGNYGNFIQNKFENKDDSKNLQRFIVKTNLLKIVLRELNLIEGGHSMRNEGQLIPREIVEYMEKLEMSPPERALFLLGVLVGEVALRQYEKNKKFPILRKINFQGMENAKVKRLSNEILEQLKIYDALDDNTTRIFSVMREFMERGENLLSPCENTYWILSGYAFQYLAKRRNKKVGGQNGE